MGGVLLVFFRRVAQLVRALARHARGRRFESARAYQKNIHDIVTSQGLAGGIFCQTLLCRQIDQVNVLVFVCAFAERLIPQP